MRGDGAEGGKPALIYRNVHRLRLRCELDDDGVGVEVDIEVLAVDADGRERVARRIDREPFAAVARAREKLGEVAVGPGLGIAVLKA